MPPTVVIPNWIEAAEPAKYYSTGYGQGMQAAQAQAEIDLANARLAQQANLAQQELAHQERVQSQDLAWKAEAARQRAEADQARISVQEAYNRMRLDAQKQQLQNAQAEIARKAALDRSAFDAMQSYQRELDQAMRLNPNADRMQVARDLYTKYGPAMQRGSVGGMGTFLRPSAPPRTTTPPDIRFNENERRRLQLDVEGIKAAYPEDYADEPEYKKKKAQLDTVEANLRNLAPAVPAPAAAPARVDVRGDLRAQAYAAIAKKADEKAVRERYRQLTGKDLD